MIIAVSDLHLGDKLSNRRGFLKFINEYLKPMSEDITEFVLLGDIFDLWRRDNSQLLLQNIDLLNSICELGFHVSYIVGNHDMIMLEFGGEQANVDMPEEFIHSSKNLSINRSRVLTSGNSKFRFIHGHQINYWYALPFYETFCKAMCHHYGVQSETVHVWSLMERYSDSISPWLLSRVHQLTKEQRIDIENKLAGPFEGYAASRAKSMQDDFELLHDFIEFDIPNSKKTQQQMIDSVRKEVQEPFWNDSIYPRIESWDDFAYIIENGTIPEIASRFLQTWSDILRYIVSNNSKKGISEHNQLLRSGTRIAAMLSGELNHDEFLIHGHGHRPFLDERSRVADAGCWLSEKATYISFTEGKISCNQYT
ncbi:hypothetical protein EU527_00720 [Candidatus Thorarchaeota archaeon]|nr:MAG: hypothetical protein EU527_00720 [Candidatus Thorarchaeota archaeon]